MNKVKKMQEINQLQNKITNDLQSFHDKTVIVGVSGGADSLCLLHILHRKGIKSIAVYVNHGLRDEALQDGLHVKDICERWKIPFQMVSINVQEFSQEEKLSIEEASRILRYRNLFDIADSEQADAVAVAHHADDQVETVLMHLLRGSGLSGLRGMSVITRHHNWHHSIPLIRPLLSAWKNEIEAYCRENDIDVVLDESNLDTAFFRNRLRHELIPNLETYNQNIKQGLLRMSSIMQDDYDILTSLLDASLKDLQVTYLSKQATFLHKNFLHMHLSLQRMVLREVISHIAPNVRDVDFAAIERAINLICGDNPGKQIDLVDDLILFIDGNNVVILPGNADYRRCDIPLMAGGKEISVQAGQSYMINNCWRFRFDLVDQIPVDYDDHGDAYCVLIDADKCGQRLRLKTITAGDRFVPCGLNGHSQKVSDIFTNLKVSRWVRNAYPLLCDENEILWIPGHRIAERVKINSDTTRVYKITLTNKN